jgi:hypothetical protein
MLKIKKSWKKSIKLFRYKETATCTVLDEKIHLGFSSSKQCTVIEEIAEMKGYSVG